MLIQVGYWCQRNLKEKKIDKWTKIPTGVLKETRSKENIIPLRSEIDNLKMKVQSWNRFYIEEIKNDSLHNIYIYIYWDSVSNAMSLNVRDTKKKE